MEKEPLYNLKVLKVRRRELRNNATEEERLLWEKLRRKQLNGHRFLRQYSAGPYILDFYCPKLRLAIELDGGQHQKRETKLYDQDRGNYLQALNIRTLRFWNSEVTDNLDKVLEAITRIASS